MKFKTSRKRLSFKGLRRRQSTPFYCVLYGPHSQLKGHSAISETWATHDARVVTKTAATGRTNFYVISMKYSVAPNISKSARNFKCNPVLGFPLNGNQKRKKCFYSVAQISLYLQRKRCVKTVFMAELIVVVLSY